MIKKKIIELTNIRFQNANQEWERVDAIVSIDEEAEEPELEISVGPGGVLSGEATRTSNTSFTIALPVQDIFDCLEYLGIDVHAWADAQVR